jgi:GxxExxY protein
METKFLHADITQKVIGAAFEVYGALGYGFLESVYKKAMQVELQRMGLRAEVESPIKVKYRDAVVGDFRADLLVSEAVIVELKTAKAYCADDEPQLLNELKATGTKGGLLINFGRTKMEFKRMIF